MKWFLIDALMKYSSFDQHVHILFFVDASHLKHLFSLPRYKKGCNRKIKTNLPQQNINTPDIQPLFLSLLLEEGKSHFHLFMKLPWKYILANINNFLKDLLNKHLILLNQPQLFVLVPYPKKKICLNYKITGCGLGSITESSIDLLLYLTC